MKRRSILLKSKQDKLEKRKTQKQQSIQKIAYQLYQNRLLIGRKGDERGDWETATKIHKNIARRLIYWFNQPLIKLEKKVIEPIYQQVEKAEIFKIFEKWSPILEAIGVLFIPIALYYIGQNYEQQRETAEKARLKQQEQQEQQRLQQFLLENYLNRLSTVLVGKDLRSDENKNAREFATAMTLTVLNDPNINGFTKGKVIRFLSQMNLVQGVGKEMPIISLQKANLSEASLSLVELPGAILVDAELVGADLRGTDLSDANLKGAHLQGAYLTGINFSGADLRGANFREVDFSPSLVPLNEVLTRVPGVERRRVRLLKSNFREADLTDASIYNVVFQEVDFEGAILAARLTEVDLSAGLNLTQEQFYNGSLCKTKLPVELMSKLDQSDCIQILE